MELSCIYDLIPGPLVGLERRDLALVIGNLGRYANAKNILSQCSRFLLKPPEAENILNQMEQQIKTTWYAVAKSVGVSEKDCETISGSFVYPGFRYSV
jgi:serine/threonine-protein kinase HipA